MPICMQINFIIQFFLTILQRKSKLVILVDLGMPGYTHLKWYLTFICRQKIKLILHVFLEILQKYCKLIVLGTLGMPGYQTQSDNINLKKAFMFICRQKINFTQIRSFSGDIAKTCKLLVLRTLAMPGCTHPKW